MSSLFLRTFSLYDLHMGPYVIKYNRGDSMFNQQEYINNYIKNQYKDIKLRVRKDDTIILNKLKSCDNVNKYILDLIRNDIINNRQYNFINNDIKIDFELSNSMQNLIDKAEEADLLDDYGLYMNLADAIDMQGKKEATHHILSEGEWHKLVRRYPIE